jgi:recombination protein RecA
VFSNLRFGVRSRGAPLAIGRRRLDELLGGGIPRGQVVEVSGSSSSGKATLAFGVCLRALEKGQAVAWIDAGGGFWPVAAVEAGLPLEKLLVVKLRDGAAALRAAHILLSSAGAVAALVVDLSAVTAPVRERELVALQRLAERSATALLFLTARSRAAASLGAAVALRLHAERRPGGRLRVEVLRNKSGASQRAIEEVMDGPDRVCADRAL